MIIVVLGLPGSGKSFFAERLAKKLDMAYLNSDSIRKELSLMPSYSFEDRLNVYDEMFNRVYTLSANGYSVILDATFYMQQLRDKLISISQSCKNAICFIEIKASEKIVEDRLLKPRTFSDADFSVYQKIKNQFEPISLDHLVLFSDSENLDEMFKRAIPFIKSYE